MDKIKPILESIVKAKKNNTILYDIPAIFHSATGVLKSYENNILRVVDLMCKESLSPEKYEMWDQVKKQLNKNRNIKQ